MRAYFVQRACPIEAPRGGRSGVRGISAHQALSIFIRLLGFSTYLFRRRWPVALQHTLKGRAAALPLAPLGLLPSGVPNALGVLSVALSPLGLLTVHCTTLMKALDPSWEPNAQ